MGNEQSSKTNFKCAIVSWSISECILWAIDIKACNWVFIKGIRPILDKKGNECVELELIQFDDEEYNSYRICTEIVSNDWALKVSEVLDTGKLIDTLTKKRTTATIIRIESQNIFAGCQICTQVSVNNQAIYYKYELRMCYQDDILVDGERMENLY